MKKIILSVMALAIVSYLVLSKKTEPEYEATENLPPPAAIETPVVETTAPDPKPKTDAAQNAIDDEVLRLSEDVIHFEYLPDPDRKWVLEQASSSYATGVITYAQLREHIEELSVFRQHAVLERTEPYAPRGVSR